VKAAEASATSQTQLLESASLSGLNILSSQFQQDIATPYLNYASALTTADAVYYKALADIDYQEALNGSYDEVAAGTQAEKTHNEQKKAAETSFNQATANPASDTTDDTATENTTTANTIVDVQAANQTELENARHDRDAALAGIEANTKTANAGHTKTVVDSVTTSFNNHLQNNLSSDTPWHDREKDWAQADANQVTSISTAIETKTTQDAAAKRDEIISRSAATRDQRIENTAAGADHNRRTNTAVKTLTHANTLANAPLPQYGKALTTLPEIAAAPLVSIGDIATTNTDAYFAELGADDYGSAAYGTSFDNGLDFGVFEENRHFTTRQTRADSSYTTSDRLGSGLSRRYAPEAALNLEDVNTTTADPGSTSDGVSGDPGESGAAGVAGNSTVSSVSTSIISGSLLTTPGMRIQQINSTGGLYRKSIAESGASYAVSDHASGTKYSRELAARSPHGDVSEPGANAELDALRDYLKSDAFKKNRPPEVADLEIKGGRNDGRVIKDEAQAGDSIHFDEFGRVYYRFGLWAGDHAGLSIEIGTTRVYRYAPFWGEPRYERVDGSSIYLHEEFGGHVIRDIVWVESPLAPLIVNGLRFREALRDFNIQYYNHGLTTYVESFAKLKKLLKWYISNLGYDGVGKLWHKTEAWIGPRHNYSLPPEDNSSQLVQGLVDTEELVDWKTGRVAIPGQHYGAAIWEVHHGGTLTKIGESFGLTQKSDYKTEFNLGVIADAAGLDTGNVLSAPGTGKYVKIFLHEEWGGGVVNFAEVSAAAKHFNKVTGLRNGLKGLPVEQQKLLIRQMLELVKQGFFHTNDYRGDFDAGFASTIIGVLSLGQYEIGDQVYNNPLGPGASFGKTVGEGALLAADLAALGPIDIVLARLAKLGRWARLRQLRHGRKLASLDIIVGARSSTFGNALRVRGADPSILTQVGPTCGPTCGGILLRRRGIDISDLDLTRETIFTGPNRGTPLRALTGILKSSGLKHAIAARMANMKALEKFVNLGDEVLIVIRHPSGEAHAIIVEKFITTGGGKYVQIIDPIDGVWLVKASDLEKLVMWSVENSIVISPNVRIVPR